MPREYKRKLGARKYGDYSTENLAACLNDIRTKKMSQRDSEKHYNIPRSTIKNKLKEKHLRQPGHPTVFSASEENSFAEHIVNLADFGFPVTSLDLRFVIKAYLDKKGVTVRQFKNNIPGPDWVKSFLKRHHTLTMRTSSNIKKVRAALDSDQVNKYFDNLELTLTDVDPSNIWNYDETNLRDDPGSPKVICKRGKKYVERIMDSSKSCISLMFVGNAAGEVLPPYVIYKAENLWDSWTVGGPQGCRYNRTKSGWFDSVTFEDWFFTLLLPKLKRQTGTKVIIGDNLSSHINPDVLQACHENDIKFVCLPPHSTHATQPLDVAFYGPMKRFWRTILTEWKLSSNGKNMTGLPKDHFPHLLAKLVERIKMSPDNIKSGFQATGISPLNRQKVLDRLSAPEAANVDLVGEAFLKEVINKRDEVTGKNKLRKRKKLSVEPGQSICVDDLTPPEEHESDVDNPEPVAPKNVKRGRPKRDAASSSSDDDFSLHDDSYGEEL